MSANEKTEAGTNQAKAIQLAKNAEWLAQRAAMIAKINASCAGRLDAFLAA